MKQTLKKHFLFIAFAVWVMNFGLTSCKGSQSVAQVNQETEVNIPCSDQFTDKNFFRGQGVGQSKDLNSAREKARMNANQELSGSIATLSKRVAEKYVNDAGQQLADYAETFESLTLEVVEQQINNVRVSCNKTMKTTDGMYKIYMAVEVGKDEVFDALNRKAEMNKKMETLYEREKFRQIYNQEMEDFSQNHK
jgi:hypothetical protein